MLQIIGRTGGEYFNIECEACTDAGLQPRSVNFSDLRWDGSVPVVTATCRRCGESGKFKLHPPSWIEMFPFPRDTE